MKKLILSFAILFAFTSNSFATHVMGADITYTSVGGNDYLVTLTLYRDCSGSTVGTTAQTINLSSSCSTFTASLDWVSTNNVSQVCASALTTCNGGTLPGTEQYIFTGIVTIPPCTDWLMSWSLCCRNDGITNLSLPGSQDLYVETTMNNILAPANNSPQFLALPTPYLCTNQLNIYNHGASDIDGDSLYYQFTTPLDGPSAPIAFATGYSQTNPILTTAGMNLNPETGEMCFTPTSAQICVVAVIVKEYRNNILIGTYIREMQVVISNTCSNSAPNSGGVPTCGNVGGISNLVAGPTVVQLDANSFSMCPMDQICFDISFDDPDGDNITVTSNIAAAIPTATFNIVSNGTQNPIGHFCWTPTPLDSGINVLTIKLADDACPISASQYYTYDITVFDQPYAGTDKIICGPQWAQLNASGGAGYSWSVLSGSPLNPGVNISCNPCTNPQVKPAVTTTYLLTSTLTAACINTDTVTVTVVPDYFVLPFGATTLCDYLSTPIGVNVNPAIGTYTVNWNNAATLSNANIATPTASPLTTTTYIATVTSPFGCVKKDSVKVNVSPPPTLTLTPGDTTICLGSSLNFDIQSTCMYTLNMLDSYSGNDGWNNQSISIYDSGVLVGTYTIPFGFNSGTASVPITNGNNITILYGTGSFQSESSFNLINGMGVTQYSVAAGGMSGWVDGATVYSGVGSCGPTLSAYTFNWTPTTGLSSSTIRNPIAIPLTTTTYTVTLADAGGCTVNRSQTVTIVPNYAINTTQSDTTVCLGEPVTFNTTTTPAGIFNYSWTPASIMNNATSANPTATFTTPGLNTIILTVDNGGGCTRTDTSKVMVASTYAPTIHIVNNDTTIGCNENVNINLSLGGGIPATCGASASTVCSGASTPRIVGTSSGANTSTSFPAPYGNYYRNAKHQFLYTAAELNALGFVGGKITQIGWEVTAINGTTSYNSYTIKMKCTNITNITTWQTGLTQVFNPKTVNIITGYNMHTFDTAYEWDGISNLVVEVCYDNLAVTYTNNSITPWATTTFTSSLWYDSDSSPACPTTSTTSSGTNRPVTKFTTCPTTPNPAAFNYSWAPTNGVSNPSIQNPVLSPNSNTTYFVTVTDPIGGCSDVDSIIVNVTSQVVASFTTIPATCNTSNDGRIIAFGSGPNPPFTFAFYDSTGVTLFQSHAGILTDTLFNASSGTYLVSITDFSGCSKDTLITLSPTSQVFLTNVNNDTTICINQTVNLTGTGTGGTGAISLIWDNGLIGNGPHTVMPLVNNNYTVYAQDIMGCTSPIDTVKIIVNPNATLSLTSAIGSDSQIVCINTPINNIVYAINGPNTGTTITGLPTGVSAVINAGVYTISGTPTTSGTFNYIVTTNGVCALVTDTGTIIIKPDATISLTSAANTNSQTVCTNTALTPINYAIAGGGSNATVTGLPAGVTGVYNAGIFTISGTPTAIGTSNYTVTTTGTCLQIAANGTITLNGPIQITPLVLGRDSVCPKDTTRITISPAIGGSGVGYTYNWFDSSNNPIGTGLSIIVTPLMNSETYTVVVGDNCSTPTISQSTTVYWSPMPQPDFTYFNNNPNECYPITVSFINTSGSSTNINSVTWDFGDGHSSNNILTANNTYSTPGCFDVKLTVVSDKNCILDTTKIDAVCARDYPIADFIMNPQPTDITDPIIQFNNQSTGNTLNFWNITGGNPSNSFEINPISEFSSDTPGTYLVGLLIENAYGCQDSTFRIVTIDGLYLFHMPNSFTPNGDHINDIFKPIGDGIDTKNYHFMIFDRWGEKLFETDDLNAGWDGTFKGNPVLTGVYVWTLKAKELYRNVNTEHTGFINLNR